MHRRAVLAAGTATLFASACNVNAQDNVAADIALDLSGPRPTAQLVVGAAAPVTAIFDTGAAASVLRLSYAQRIAASNQGDASAHGPGGSLIHGFRTTLDNARLGDARFGGALAVALDIPLPLENIDAIISPGVFAGRLIRFDFANSIAHVLPLTAANTPPAPAETYIGEAAHNQINRTPGVTVTLPGGTAFQAICDTGAKRGLTLPMTMAQGAPLSEPQTPDEPVRMFGSELRTVRSRINGAVRIGGVMLENPEVHFAENAPYPMVGVPILRNTVVVVDPRGERDWVLPPS